MEFEGFSHLDSAGDARLRVWAQDLSGLFAVALKGFTSLITEPSTVRPLESVPVQLNATGREELFVAWLNELVFLLDTRGFVASRAAVDHISETSVTATVFGERLDPERHERRLLVKAATYHGLYVRNTENGLTGEITLDL